MYARSLRAPNHSFFLFGPRSTGKTTWLKREFKESRYIDLLDSSVYLKLLRDPDALYQEIAALEPNSWIIIDEIQRIPELLNTIHRVINDFGDSYKMVLSGSSARKLKTMQSNLLAGKVINRLFFPIIGQELEFDFEIEELLKLGMLPKVLANRELAFDVLESYVANYLDEEIKAEAATKNLDSFTRFLEVAAILNGQVINYSRTASDAGVARTTVERYFQILVDTLVAFRLPAWNPRAKVKEISKPKFYFFDPGVVRTLTNRVREPLDSLEKGFLLETLILNELRAHISYANIGGKLSYWSTSSKAHEDKEIDFIWSRGKRNIGFEIKSSANWRKGYGTYLKEFHNKGIIQKAYGVYLGDTRLKDGSITVLPIKEFMKELSIGNLLA